MPIIVAAPVTPATPTVAHSADARLTATLDPQWSGVLLVADYSDTTYGRRFEWHGVRANGEDYLLRGFEDYPAPGGRGIAYDHEARLAEPTSWYVVQNGVKSQLVALTVPDPLGGEGDPGCWVKSLEDPALSVHMMVNTMADEDWSIPNDLSSVWGSAFPVGTVDVMKGSASSITLLAMDKGEVDEVRSLLEAGGPVLIQTKTDFGRDDIYAIITGATVANPSAKMGNPERLVTLSYVQTARPAEYGVARIPGRSYADRLAAYPTYGAVPTRSYLAALGF